MCVLLVELGEILVLVNRKQGRYREERREIKRRKGGGNSSRLWMSALVLRNM